MKELRLREGQNVVFDAAKDVLDGRVGKGKVMMKMKNGPISYETDAGTKFYAKHPYQWVTHDEATQLSSLHSPEFVIVPKEDAEDFYAS